MLNEKQSRKEWKNGYPLVIEHSHGIDGPNRNRWFTDLKNGGSFHGKPLVTVRYYQVG